MPNDGSDNSISNEQLIEFIRGNISHTELAHTLEWTSEETSDLLFDWAVNSGFVRAASTINFVHPGPANDDVKPEQYVAVVLNKLKIRRLFSDKERDVSTTNPGNQTRQIVRKQEGDCTFIINETQTPVAWFRMGEFEWQRIGRYWEWKWDEYESEPTTLLYAGKAGKHLKLNVGLTESEDSERVILDRLKEILSMAASAAGLVPGYGSIIGAGLSLGATIAELVKARLQDDRELRYLGSLGDLGGAEPVHFRFGDYQITRKRDFLSNDIEVNFSVLKLVPPNESLKRLTIVLETVDLENFQKENDGNQLNANDTLSLEATITAPSNDKDSPKPTVSLFKFEHPWRARTGDGSIVPLNDVAKINNQVLFDGVWGPIITFNFSAAATPRNLHTEQWLAVLSATGELVGNVVSQEDATNVTSGFEIAQDAANFVLNYVPDKRFVNSKKGLFVKAGDHLAPPNCLIEIDMADTTNWQMREVKLSPIGFGDIVFKLNVKVTDTPPPLAVSYLALLLDEQSINSVDADPETWSSYLWGGGPGRISAFGIWDGATIEIEISNDKAIWNPIDNSISFSQNGDVTFGFLGPGNYIRSRMRGVTVGSNNSVSCVLDDLDKPILPFYLLNSQAVDTVNPNPDSWNSLSWTGGGGRITAFGRWNATAPAAEVVIEVSDDNQNWTAMISPAISFRGDDTATFDFLPTNKYIRANLQNAGANSLVTCVLEESS